ncbi:allophanate hydrolase [Alteribacillus sp. YIM 98480]|uniref:allophanate hydrolase n=1 Tax=Alteribacillus sp. YIM 98480 TaxID=2606599 RepID=UPI00131D22C2|nr:allophanate hydrolase [Alteribacillus sp. YIM 98480]
MNRKLTILGLQQAYKNQGTTPKEVIETIVEQAKADEDMNIWITPPSLDWILPYLKNLEEMDPEDAPLWGVPFALKDNIDLAGIPTTAGCLDYAYTPPEHAAVAERLIAAGAIPVGKTNLDQFATGLVGTRSPYGETHNSLREELISGGSSAGSPVAVARGQAAFALGTDTAGSGRVPAALNNLVGFKPSLGAWPIKGVVPACESLDCVTVFSHSLQEALEVDAVVRGEDESDPWSKSMTTPAGKQPERVLLPKETPSFYGPYAEKYEEAWKKAVGRLGELDMKTEYIDTNLFSEAASILYGGPWIAERWAALGDFIEKNPNSAFPVTEQVLCSGSSDKYDAASVFHAIHKLQAIKLETKKLLKNAVLALPTCGGTWTREQVRKDPIQTNNDMGRYTNHCNLLDLSAVAVPGKEADKDLPFGITLFGLAESENLVFGAAAAFSKETIQTAPNSSEQETTLVAVCGLHMRGFPLEQQMYDHGARFVQEANTAPKYKFYKLPSEPIKPGLIKQPEGGDSIQLEIWEMPLTSFGSFTAQIPAPLGIGKVELEDGKEIPGFVCEGYGEKEAEDVTTLGSWDVVVQS